MPNQTKFKPGQSGNPSTRFKAGNPHRWQPGQSGNPGGISRSRLQFEESFYAVLLARGNAEDVASLLWQSAQEREPWAIQALLQRLAPETKQIDLKHGFEDANAIDYARLSAEDLDTLQRLMERATVPIGAGESGEGSSQPEGIRDVSVGDFGTQQ
jgi:hypothetical protein